MKTGIRFDYDTQKLSPRERQIVRAILELAVTVHGSGVFKGPGTDEEKVEKAATAVQTLMTGQFPDLNFRLTRGAPVP